MYGFESEGKYSRVQAYLKAHGGWQLEAVSIVHFHSLGRQLDQTGHLLLTVVMRTGRLLLTVVLRTGRLLLTVVIENWSPSIDCSIENWSPSIDCSY